jgi:glutathione S-transferase
MKLFYSVTSPYSRKVLLLARSLGMGNDIEVVMANPIENDPALLKVNPLGKVPALVQAGKTYVDSPFIAEHLLRLAGQDRMSDDYMKRLEVQAIADGITDAAVAIRLETSRPDAEVSMMWLGRWHAAIDRSLSFLEQELLDSLSGWKLDSIAVACMLDYLCFRLPDIDWQNSHPKLAAWFADVIIRKDMRDTDPRS